jgi:acylphosphatase
VQGVFYRATTEARARELGLDGWVRNLADGGVEVVARGPPEALAALSRWLWEGPPGARVEAVQAEEWTEHVDRGFDVRR